MWMFKPFVRLLHSSVAMAALDKTFQPMEEIKFIISMSYVNINECRVALYFVDKNTRRYSCHKK